MPTRKVNYVWHKQSMDPECRTIDCSVYDPIKDFRRDPTGYYVLIRPDFTTRHLEVAICNKEHHIVMVFRGKSSVDVYEGIFGYERKHHKQWFSDKAHAAYIGKELKKAEIALVLGQNNYFQD